MLPKAKTSLLSWKGLTLTLILGPTDNALKAHTIGQKDSVTIINSVGQVIKQLQNNNIFDQVFQEFKKNARKQETLSIRRKKTSVTIK